MRLERLTLHGIGPFAGTEVVDFAAVGRQGLFLLEGPTGSGKSTVIDAICFALYGQVAASAGSTERIASHHLPPGGRPEVELVFATGRGRYRICRTPEFARPKARGTGTTLERASQQLYRLTGEDDLTGELLTTSAREVGDEVLDAIGLNREQFVKTVVLPQGEFANFLRATSQDKAKLLERLFAADGYRGVQEELKALGDEAQRRRQEAATLVTQRIDAFAGAAGVADEERDALLAGASNESLGDPAGEAPGVGAAGGQAGPVTLVVRRLTAERARCEAAAREAGRVRGEAVAAVEAAERLEGLRARRTELYAIRDELARAAPAYQGDRQALQVGLRAAAVEPAHRRLLAAREAAAAAAQVLTDRAELAAGLLDPAGGGGEGDGSPSTAAGQEAVDGEALGAHGVGGPAVVDPTLGDRVALDRAVAHRHGLRGTLPELVALEAGLPARERALAALDRDVLDRAERAGQVRDLLTQVPEQLRALDDELTTLAARAGALPGLEQACEQAQNRLAAARQVSAAEAAARQAQHATATAATAAQDAATALAAAHRARIASIAGELGQALVPGEDCPVCGSREHPRPASPGGDHVDAAAVAAASEAHEQAVAALETARRSADRADRRLSDLLAAAGELSEPDAVAAVDAARQERDAARAAQGRTETLRTRRERLDAEAAQARAQAEALLVEHAALQARARSDRQVLADDTGRVAAGRGGYASVAARADALERELRTLEGYGEALTQHRLAESAGGQALSAFREALGVGGFADEASWHTGWLAADDLTRLADQVADHERWEALVAAGLADPALADPRLDEPAADLAELAGRRASAEAAADEATRAAGTAKDRADQAARAAELVLAAARELRQVRQETADAIRVGQIATGHGENVKHIELTNYVLIRRFQDVVEVANFHLQKMSAGRYELAHTDARRGTAKAGLDLRVVDHETDRERDIATLSGGESFYVSLALALALAEVVQGETGGLQLGTLFIDEGFGSLDSETLDVVLRTLDGLRAEGRTVGVISHVADLKRIIGERIEVRPCPGRPGSTLTVIA